MALFHYRGRQFHAVTVRDATVMLAGGARLHALKDPVTNGPEASYGYELRRKGADESSPPIVVSDGAFRALQNLGVVKRGAPSSGAAVEAKATSAPARAKASSRTPFAAP